MPSAATRQRHDPHLDGLFNLLVGKFNAWSVAESQGLCSADLHLLSAEKGRPSQSARVVVWEQCISEDFRVPQVALSWQPAAMHRCALSARTPTAPSPRAGAVRTVPDSKRSKLKRVCNAGQHCRRVCPPSFGNVRNVPPSPRPRAPSALKRISEQSPRPVQHWRFAPHRSPKLLCPRGRGDALSYKLDSEGMPRQQTPPEPDVTRRDPYGRDGDQEDESLSSLATARSYSSESHLPRSSFASRAGDRHVPRKNGRDAHTLINSHATPVQTLADARATELDADPQAGLLQPAGQCHDTPSLKVGIPRHWSDERRLKTNSAVDRFEAKHREHVVQAGRSARQCVQDADGNQPYSTAFRGHVGRLARNRLAVPEEAPEPVRIYISNGQSVVKSSWTWPGHIWTPRKKWAASHDYYDTDDVLAKAIESDWDKALARHGLRAHLLRSEPLMPDPRDATAYAAMAKQRLSEMQEVMIRNGHTFFSTFNFYCTLGAGDDLVHIGKGGYARFLVENELVIPGSKACAMAQLDLVFVQANTPSKKPGHEREHVKRNALSRHEFMQCFLRIAVARFLQSGQGKAKNVAEALEELFANIRLKASREVLQMSNHFRKLNCYTEEVDCALLAHERELRVFFKRFSRGGGPDMGKRHESVELMSADEWVALCRGLSLLGDDLSIEESQQHFLWSRMLVIDEDSPVERKRIYNLSFEDFLEGLVRLAHGMALPTDQEVTQAGFDNAGEFLADLKANDPTAYTDFVARHKGAWDKPLRQPIDRQLTHLMDVIMVEVGSKKTALERRKPRRSIKPDANTRDAPGPLSDAALYDLTDAIDTCAAIEAKAAICVQAIFRGRMARIRKRVRLQTLVVVQSVLRGLVLHRAFAKQRRSCTFLQAAMRGWRARRQISALNLTPCCSSQQRDAVVTKQHRHQGNLPRRRGGRSPLRIRPGGSKATALAHLLEQLIVGEEQLDLEADGSMIARADPVRPAPRRPLAQHQNLNPL